MRLRLFVRSVVVLVLTFACTTPALANSLASWVWVWPGVVSIEPFFGLLPTVLVSFIERPFVSRAGVIKRPLLRSIRANLLSLLAGMVVAPAVWSIRSMQGLVLFAVVAVAITMVVEIAYLSFALRNESGQLLWRWIIVGNIVSNLVLVAIALTVRILGEQDSKLWIQLLPYQGPLWLIHAIISLTAVTVAVFEPAIHWLRAKCARRSAVARDAVAGQLVSVVAEDGRFAVMKLLAIDPRGVHVRLYVQRFAARPTATELAALELKTLPFGPDHDNPFSIGHLPISRSNFAAWQPEPICRSEVTEAELAGYWMWEEAQGGYF